RGSLEGSYTWGKSIDTSSGSLVGDEYSNSISSPLWFNPRLNRGLSDFNIAQNLEVNYTWEIGTPKWAAGIKRWALGGWQTVGVFEASTGVPFTPGFGGDALGVKSTDPNIDVPNLIAGPGCGSLVNSGNPVSYIKTQCFAVPNPITLRGNLGRNTLIGPGLVNFDFSLFKNNYIKRISDRFNAQFRAEFFNILNHANFAPPLDNRNIFNATGSPVDSAGLITSTQTPSGRSSRSPPASGGCDGRAATLAWSIGWKLYLYQELTLGSCASQKHTCLTYLAGLRKRREKRTGFSANDKYTVSYSRTSFWHLSEVVCAATRCLDNLRQFRVHCFP